MEKGEKDNRHRSERSDMNGVVNSVGPVSDASKSQVSSENTLVLPNSLIFLLRQHVPLTNEEAFCGDVTKPLDWTDLEIWLHEQTINLLVPVLQVQYLAFAIDLDWILLTICILEQCYYMHSSPSVAHPFQPGNTLASTQGPNTN